MTIDLRISGDDRLQSKIQEASWQQKLTPNDYTLSLPVESIGEHWNTRVIVGAPEGSGKVFGRRTCYYRRINLEDAFPLGITLPPPTTETHLTDLLETVYETYHIRLLPSDIVDALLNTNPPAITANPHSFGWIGATTLTFVGTPTYIPDTLLFDGGGYFRLDSGNILKND